MKDLLYERYRLRSDGSWKNISRLFNVNELPKRTTDCCIAEKRGARVAKFGFPPGQFRPVIFIREECNARHSDMRNGIECALE